jgi:hypothetical protein
MPRSRTLIGLILLATFVVGGALGPSLHRAQHAMEAGEAPSHTHAAADGPVWCGEPPPVQTPDCALCTSRLVVVRPSPGQALRPHLLFADWEAEYAHLTSSAVVKAPLIRGPPVLG